MKTQTAVEWLAVQFDSIVELNPSQYSKINNAIDQAKAMEKEQIIDSFGVGCQVESTRLIGYQDIADEYYQKTYGK